MEWKTVESDVWKPENDGESIEGVYVSCVPKTDIMSARYYLDTQKGHFLVWGTAILDNRMALVKIGQMVRITYKGIVKNSRKQDMKVFKVETTSETITEENI